MYIKNPMNYIGGKNKVLGDILKIFPDNIGIFVDLFAGGFNVGININSPKIIYNDHNIYILQLYSYLAQSNAKKNIKRS